jgi:hypothetical protein
MKDSLKKNVWMGVLAAVAGTTYVVYMVVTKNGSFSQVIGTEYCIALLCSCALSRYRRTLLTEALRTLCDVMSYHAISAM